jgi:hypothetical protein
MQTKTLLFLPIFLSLQTAAIDASEFVVRDADGTWEANSQLSAELLDATSDVSPRISIEYANTLYLTDMQQTPAEFAEIAGKVASGRMIIHYAQSTWEQELIFPQGLIKLPDISVSASSHDFGEIAIGDSLAWTLVVSNEGNGILEVSAISSSNFPFHVSPVSFSVPAGENVEVEVMFAPSSPDSQSSTIIVTSDDPDEGELEITAFGLARVPGPIPGSGSLTVNPITLTTEDEVVLSISGAFPTANVGIDSTTHSINDHVITVDVATRWVGNLNENDDEVTSWTVEKNLGHLEAGDYQVEININGERFLSSSCKVRENNLPRGLVYIDFDLDDGDQEKREIGNAIPGLICDLQLNLNIRAISGINGWSVTIEFDPTQVRYVSNSFSSGGFLPGLVPLVDDQEREVSIGGAVLGSSIENSETSVLGTLSFEILEGFTGETELIITENNFRLEGGGSEKYEVFSTATITSEQIESSLAGDFDGSGKVDFTDFFLFADGFGGTDPKYDLDGDGAVGFGDFFIFADNFGKEAQAKLIALAQKYLGLPVAANLGQNYPNPFNSSTTISYRLGTTIPVSLHIFDLTGQEVKTLVDDIQMAGFYEIQWHGTNERGEPVSTGVYLIKLQADNLARVAKMLKIK